MRRRPRPFAGSGMGRETGGRPVRQFVFGIATRTAVRRWLSRFRPVTDDPFRDARGFSRMARLALVARASPRRPVPCLHEPSANHASGGSHRRPPKTRFRLRFPQGRWRDDMGGGGGGDKFFGWRPTMPRTTCKTLLKVCRFEVVTRLQINK